MEVLNGIVDIDDVAVISAWDRFATFPTPALESVHIQGNPKPCIKKAAILMVRLGFGIML
jgi:hypothetical protein